jgi:tripartite ATP-independent transporter DctM subunit
MEATAVLLVLMIVSLAGLLMSGYPVAITLAGTSLMVAAVGLGLAGPLGLDLGRLDWGYVNLFPVRIFGTMTNEVLLAVPLFIFMGTMLEKSRVAEDLLDSMAQLFGRMRGGLGISVTVVGALLAASTGIVGATVVTMGLIALPSMLKRGYDPGFAAGSIAAAGTLGQIIPPSIVLVLLSDVLSGAYQQAQRAQNIFSPEPLTTGDLFAGAFIPGLMLVGLYILYQLGVALLKPEMAPAIIDDIEPLDTGRLITSLLSPLLLIMAVLGSIISGLATPTEAASVGAIGAIYLGAFRETPGRSRALVTGLFATILLLIFPILQPGPPGSVIGIFLLLLVLLGAWGLFSALSTLNHQQTLKAAMTSTLKITSMVFTILIGAALFSLVFRGLGGDSYVSSILAGMPGGRIGALVTVMLVMFVLGFFLDFIEITFIVVPIVAPTLFMMGFDPIWIGVMMAINLQTSFLTPPFGFALFYLRGVAPAGFKTATLYKGVIPFVIIQLLALAILALIPEAATWLPGVIFGN